MNRRELLRAIEPDPKSACKITLETSADSKRVTVTLESEVKMNALDFLTALTDYVNEFATEIYTRNRGKS